MVENETEFEEFVCRNNQNNIELDIKNKTWVSFGVDSIRMIIIEGIECYNIDYKKYSNKV